MSILQCDSAGIQALRHLSAALIDSKEKIETAANGLESSVQDHAEHLGPLAQRINEAIENIRNAIESSSEPVKELSEKLNTLASDYEEYSGSGGGQTSSAGRSRGDYETRFEKEMTNEPEISPERPPAQPGNWEAWQSVKDVPFAGDKKTTRTERNSFIESLKVDIPVNTPGRSRRISGEDEFKGPRERSLPEYEK